MDTKWKGHTPTGEADVASDCAWKRGGKQQHTSKYVRTCKHRHTDYTDIHGPMKKTDRQRERQIDTEIDRKTDRKMDRQMDI